MTNRSATDTIKGYFYQFDYSIKKILESPNPNDSVTIEGLKILMLNLQQMKQHSV